MPARPRSRLPLYLLCAAVLAVSAWPGGFAALSSTVITKCLFFWVETTGMANPNLALSVLVVLAIAVLVFGLFVFVRILSPVGSGDADDEAGCDGGSPLARASAMTLVAVGLTVLMVFTRIPMRLAFMVSLPAFEEAREQAPLRFLSGRLLSERTRLQEREREYERGRPRPVKGPRWLGLYHVDKAWEHRDGSVWFRTTSYYKFFMDTVNCGFVYRPGGGGSEPDGHTPFGTHGYSETHIMGDWYMFRVVDDF